MVDVGSYGKDNDADIVKRFANGLMDFLTFVSQVKSMGIFYPSDSGQ